MPGLKAEISSQWEEEMKYAKSGRAAAVAAAVFVAEKGKPLTTPAP
jgi:hypothetical protein